MAGSAGRGPNAIIALHGFQQRWGGAHIGFHTKRHQPLFEGLIGENCTDGAVDAIHQSGRHAWRPQHRNPAGKIKIAHALFGGRWRIREKGRTCAGGNRQQFIKGPPLR